MIKKNINNILYILGSLFVIYISYNNYHVVNYKLYHLNKGIIDTTIVYNVAPKFIKKITNNNKTFILFYNKDREFVIRIKEDSLNNYIIKK